MSNSQSSKRILLLSAYDAKSHRYWHQQLISKFPQHNWQILTLKDRHFAWRMGGNALNFKAQFNQQLGADYDLLIATSMTDLSTLLGLYPHLSALPKHLYFHENQFAYPVNTLQKGLLEIQIRSIYSALAADFLWFNSKYNLDTFLAGIKNLIDQMPDGIPTKLIQTLIDKSSVLPVPISDDCRQTKKLNHDSNTVQVVWNHRWEHDKGPETLLEVLRLCKAQEHIQFHVIGQQFRTMPPAMQAIVEKHAHQCLTLGYIESRSQYINTLQQADVVLSTAQHDFQGLAMLEAVACGCVPIAPDSLVYPELYPTSNLYPSSPQLPKSEAKYIVNLIMKYQQLKSTPVTSHWQHLLPAYTELIDAI